MSLANPAIQSLQVTGVRARRMRSGSSPELAAITSLGISLDGTTFTDAGPLLRIAGGWESGDPALPAPGTTFYLRAHGVVASEFTNGSRGTVQSVASLSRGALTGPLFGNGFE